MMAVCRLELCEGVSMFKAAGSILANEILRPTVKPALALASDILWLHTAIKKTHDPKRPICMLFVEATYVADRLPQHARNP